MTAGDPMSRTIKDLSAGAEKREGREKSAERAIWKSEKDTEASGPDRTEDFFSALRPSPTYSMMLHLSASDFWYSEFTYYKSF